MLQGSVSEDILCNPPICQMCDACVIWHSQNPVSWNFSQCITSFRTLQIKPHVHHSPVVDRVYVEVDKPAEGVLVHRVYVSQVGNAEEQDRGVLGNGSVTFSRLSDFDLCLLCNLGNMETVEC